MRVESEAVAQFFRRLASHPKGRIAVTGSAGAPTEGELNGRGPNGDGLNYGALLEQVEQLAQRLAWEKVHVLASILDNGVQWIITDLAALRAGIVHVPLPAFFTVDQQRHVLEAAGVDTVIGPRIETGWQRLSAMPVPIPQGTAKITFTSGSTGTPKGVCLSAAAMLGVASGILDATEPLGIERHLCALPLPVLLENIAGLYAPLLRGATIIAPALVDVGLQGSSTFDPAVLDATVRDGAAQSVVLLPQMLRGWTAWLRATRAIAPDTLRLVAVGGAQVGSAALSAARAVGLPAHEGYGLSEGGSVQTLNLPGADRLGSAGRALPHAQIRIADDGEIEVGGTWMLGYLGDVPAAPSGWRPTGDLGAIDADGYLRIDGRKKDVLITGYGRNVSPEWVEGLLQAVQPIARAVVMGDGRPALGAVLWPMAPSVSDDELARAVARANAQLPDYAAVRHWVRARHPFDAASGLATSNGRPRRAMVASVYLNELFQPQEV